MDGASSLRLAHRVIVLHPVLALPKSVDRVGARGPCHPSVARRDSPSRKTACTGPLYLGVEGRARNEVTFRQPLPIVLFVTYLL